MMSKKEFQEVALSLTEPGHMLLAGESTPPTLSTNRAQTQPSIRDKKPFQICKLPRVTTCIELDRASVSSTSTMRDFDTESLEIDTTQTELLSAISAPAQVFLATAASKHQKKIAARGAATVDLRLGKELTFTDRVDSWERALRNALALDAAGDSAAAIVAYGKINRQVTRDAILEYEKMNSDQKKLMNNVMNCLDRRTMVLRSESRGSRPCSIGSTFSAGSVSTQPIASATSAQASAAQQEQQASATALPSPPAVPSHPSFEELEDCLKHFPTIKVLASSKKMPVVLVYGEHTHRKSHRFQDKGKSNTIIYPKEKRDFLQIMGLPGKMITTKGLDFNVKPEIDSSGVRIHYSPQRSRSASTEDRSQRDDKENNGSIMETVLDSTNSLSVNEEDHPQGKPKRRMSAMNIIKKQSVGPHPDSAGGGSSKKSSGKKSKSKSKEKKLLPPEDVEIRSMLSCDSCSSSEEYESESDVCEHDVAVPSNYSHENNLQPEPFYGLDLTYITIELEKIGVHNSRVLISPFIRMSIRDKDGDLVEGTSVQESSVGEIINKNYLRMEGSIYIQLALQALPDDIGVFLELVHHRAHLNCLSTHCYTYLEKEQLKDGEFICELYNPPIDFSRKKFTPYSEKALFLHMRLNITNG